MFHRQFPERKLNPTLLRKVYRLHGIKKKVLIYKKRLKPHMAEKFEQLKQELREAIAEMKEQGYELCYTDECMFTRTSVAKGEWSQRRANVEID